MGQLENMELFINIIEAGSMSKAAENMKLAKSAVSKRLGDLEALLGCQLITRTTRQSSLTAEGEIFYHRAKRVIEDVSDLTCSLTQSHTKVSGKMRISIPFSFGQEHVGPALMEFLDQNPELELDVDLSDRAVDVVEEGFDLAIRIGVLADSTLVARKIAPIRLVLAASPDFIAAHGPFDDPSQITSDIILSYAYARNQRIRLVGNDGEAHFLNVKGRLRANNGDFLSMAAKNGQGIVLTPTFISWRDLANGE
ncbi:MAG: LysR family transcriptional regulator, partial [Alphaproteobacteria bacterium]|nr:LysR family transcriptional regulator [Alphaproteobacteria bacterium]